MDVKGFYREVSSHYHDETFEETSALSSITRKDRTQRVLDMLDRSLTGSSTILDIGCGPAQFAVPLLERGHTYLGIDLSPEMYGQMASRLAGHPKASFQPGSVEKIPLADNSVDAVICIGVIEYIRENQAALVEIRRVLRKPGVAIFSFPNLRYPIFLLRTALRPILAPVLRVIAPRLRGTVYVSGITHRNLVPKQFLREAAQHGYEVRAQCSHGYYPILFNYRLNSLQWYDRMERWGTRFFPALGANYIVCLWK